MQESTDNPQPKWQSTHVMFVTHALFRGLSDDSVIDFFDRTIPRKDILSDKVKYQEKFAMDMKRGRLIHEVDGDDYASYLKALATYINNLPCASLLKYAFVAYCHQHRLTNSVCNIMQLLGAQLGYQIPSPKLQVKITTGENTNKFNIVIIAEIRQAIRTINGVFDLDHPLTLQNSEPEPPLLSIEAVYSVTNLADQHVRFQAEKFEVTRPLQPSSSLDKLSRSFAEQVKYFAKHLYRANQYIESLTETNDYQFPHEINDPLAELLYRFALSRELNPAQLYRLLANTKQIRFGEEIRYQEKAIKNIQARLFLYLPYHQLILKECVRLRTVKLEITPPLTIDQSAFLINFTQCPRLILQQCRIQSSKKITVQINHCPQIQIVELLAFYILNPMVDRLSFEQREIPCSKELYQFLTQHDSDLNARCEAALLMLRQEQTEQCLELLQQQKVNLIVSMYLEKFKWRVTDLNSSGIVSLVTQLKPELNNKKLESLPLFHSRYTPQLTSPLQSITQLNLSHTAIEDTALQELKFLPNLRVLELDYVRRLTVPQFPLMLSLEIISMRHCILLMGFNLIAPKLTSAHFDGSRYLQIQYLVSLMEAIGSPIEEIRLTLNGCLALQYHLFLNECELVMTPKHIQENPAVLSALSNKIRVAHEIDFHRYLDVMPRVSQLAGNQHEGRLALNEIMDNLKFSRNSINGNLKKHFCPDAGNSRTIMSSILFEIQGNNRDYQILLRTSNGLGSDYKEMLLFMLATESFAFIENKKVSLRNCAMEFLGYYFMRECHITTPCFRILDQFIKSILNDLCTMIIFHPDNLFCITQFDSLLNISISSQAAVSIRERSRLTCILTLSLLEQLIHIHQFVDFVALHLTDVQIANYCILYWLGDRIELSSFSKVPNSFGMEHVSYYLTKMKDPTILMKQYILFIKALNYQTIAKDLLFLGLDYFYHDFDRASWHPTKLNAFEESLQQVSQFAPLFPTLHAFFKSNHNTDPRTSYSYISPYVEHHPIKHFTVQSYQ